MHPGWVDISPPGASCEQGHTLSTQPVSLGLLHHLLIGGGGGFTAKYPVVNLQASDTAAVHVHALSSQPPNPRQGWILLFLILNLNRPRRPRSLSSCFWSWGWFGSCLCHRLQRCWSALGLPVRDSSEPFYLEANLQTKLAGPIEKGPSSCHHQGRTASLCRWCSNEVFQGSTCCYWPRVQHAQHTGKACKLPCLRLCPCSLLLCLQRRDHNCQSQSTHDSPKPLSPAAQDLLLSSCGSPSDQNSCRKNQHVTCFTCGA